MKKVYSWDRLQWLRRQDTDIVSHVLNEAPYFYHIGTKDALVDGLHGLRHGDRELFEASVGRLAAHLRDHEPLYNVAGEEVRDTDPESLLAVARACIEQHAKDIGIH